MVKAEWGAKPWLPEMRHPLLRPGQGQPCHMHRMQLMLGSPRPVLKSKQPIPYEEVQKEKAPETRDNDLADDDLDIDDDGDSPDNDVDLGGDDDLGVRRARRRQRQRALKTLPSSGGATKGRASRPWRKFQGFWEPAASQGCR